MNDSNQIAAPKFASRKLTLTNTAITAALPGETLWDIQVPGLHLRVTPTKKAYYLYFRTKLRQERRPKLGDVRILSLAQARENARAMLGEVAGGGDPIADRAVAQAEPTMDDLWDRCAREHWNGGRQWDRDALRLYKRNVAPKVGRLRVRALTYADLEPVRAALAKTPIEGNRTIAILSKMLNLAERFGQRATGTNPCQHLQRFPERKRRRFAKAAEIATIGPLLEAEATRAEAMKNKHTAAELRRGVAFLYILMFSGARPSEIERATWPQLERKDDCGVLRIDEGKTGQRDVFLPAVALAHIDRLPKGGRTIVGCKMPRRLWERVRTAAGCADLWARDWRRTFATTAMSNGVNPGMVGELLGHKSAQTTKIYAKLMEDPAFAAATATAGHLQTMLRGKSNENQIADAGGPAGPDGVHDAGGPAGAA